MLNVLISLVVILFLSSCGSKTDLFQEKTNITNAEKVKKVVHMLDWKEYKIEEVTIDENNIILHLLGARLDFNEEDLQTMVTNGSLLLVLVEDANSIQYEYDEPAFAVDREMAGTMLKTNFNKTIEDFRKSKEDFKELQDGLPKVKTQAGVVQ